MKHPLNVEYFDFEKDFIEDNIRCIPMIVRFKLDACGIKLKLKEWSLMSNGERALLAQLPVDDANQIKLYQTYLINLIKNYTRQEASPTTDVNHEWMHTQQLPSALVKKLAEDNLTMSLQQWKGLNMLQRFALIKLTRPGHENKNFPMAMKEFGLI